MTPPPSPARARASTQTEPNELDQLHVLAMEAIYQSQQRSPSLSPRRGSEDLEHENDVLRRHLERIGRMSTSQGGFNVGTLQLDCEKWRDKYGHCKREREKLKEELKKEREESTMLRAERESLLSTIQMLQAELEQSEHMRNHRDHLGQH